MRIAYVDQYQVLGITSMYWAYDIDLEDLTAYLG
jgi:hypothetical protein